MIPLSLVTGFLGAGKTTFLKRIVDKHADNRIVYLVNEFSPQDMDGIQLEQEADTVMSIPGGSIFCRCLAGQFIDYLTDIPKKFHHPGKPVSGVVIEASGVADPSVAGRMLREYRLDRIYEMRRIVCVVDPGSVHKLLETLPNIKSQIRSADTILINKTDLFEEGQINRTENTLRELAPETTIVKAEYCNADIGIFEQPATAEAVQGTGGDYALCKDPNYEHLLIECTEPVNADWLKSKLDTFAADIYRAKGMFLAEDEAKKWLEYTANGMTVTPADSRLPAEQVPRMTFILRTGAGENLKPIIEKLGRIVVHA